MRPVAQRLPREPVEGVVAPEPRRREAQRDEIGLQLVVVGSVRDTRGKLAPRRRIAIEKRHRAAVDPIDDLAARDDRAASRKDGEYAWPRLVDDRVRTGVAKSSLQLLA